MLSEILVGRQRALKTSQSKLAPSRSKIRVGVEKNGGGLVLSFFTFATGRRILSGAGENVRKGVRSGGSLAALGVAFIR